MKPASEFGKGKNNPKSLKKNSNKEQDEKHGKKTEYKQIEISIFSNTYH